MGFMSPSRIDSASFPGQVSAGDGRLKAEVFVAPDMVRSGR